jgi:hypothetical protein
MKMRALLKQYWWPVLIVLLIGVWIGIEAVLHRGISPEGRAETLTQYLQWRPADDHFATTNVAGESYVIAYGRYAGTLPSGPSAYIFAANGELVDWSRDIGDDPEFHRKWIAQGGKDKSLSRAEVEKIVDGRAE